MSLIKKLSEAIWELQAMNVRREEMVIAMSFIVFYQFERSIMEFAASTISTQSFKEKLKDVRFEGVSMNQDWPYNEIVIYAPKLTPQHPQLIKKIEFHVTDKDSIGNFPVSKN